MDDLMKIIADDGSILFHRRLVLAINLEFLMMRMWQKLIDNCLNFFFFAKISNNNRIIIDFQELITSSIPKGYQCIGWNWRKWGHYVDNTLQSHRWRVLFNHLIKLLNRLPKFVISVMRPSLLHVGCSAYYI